MKHLKLWENFSMDEQASFDEWWANGGLDFSDYLYREEAIKNSENELLELTSDVESPDFTDSNNDNEISYWNIIIGECEKIARKNDTHLKYPNPTKSFRDMLKSKSRR